MYQDSWSRFRDQIYQKLGKDTSSVPQGFEIVPKCRASERHEIIFADAKKRCGRNLTDAKSRVASVPQGCEVLATQRGLKSLRLEKTLERIKFNMMSTSDDVARASVDQRQRRAVEKVDWVKIYFYETVWWTCSWERSDRGPRCDVLCEKNCSRRTRRGLRVSRRDAKCWRRGCRRETWCWRKFRSEVQ